VWLSTVTAGGTPQPNPVWFLWQPDSGDPWGDGSFLVYHLGSAKRLASLEARPPVSLHFNSTPDGGDIVVFTGRVEVLPGYPAAHEVPDYVQKYTAAVGRATGGKKTVEEFMADYPVASRIRPGRVRGF
jgi:PPOX class probable F420-dependent enzyme